MFFVASKVFWLVAQPSNFIGLCLAAAIIGLFTPFAGTARQTLIFVGLAYLVCGFGPVGPMMLRPLEDRFPRPPSDLPPPDGIIVLGGAMDESVSDARNALVLNENGSRMTEAMALALRFPKIPVIFTGGTGDLGKQAISEAEAARRLFTALGLPPERLILEDKSRNTIENASLTKEIVAPRPGQKFLLVTSGFHMPRAMGVFRRAGFDVIAWPADYATSGRSSDFIRPSQHASDSLALVDRATREWIGLIAYRLAGMTDELLPRP